MPSENKKYMVLAKWKYVKFFNKKCKKQTTRKQVDIIGL